MSHIPIAFDVLGVLATLYVLAVTFEAKARDSRTRRRSPSERQRTGHCHATRDERSGDEGASASVTTASPP